LYFADQPSVATDADCHALHEWLGRREAARLRLMLRTPKNAVQVGRHSSGLPVVGWIETGPPGESTRSPSRPSADVELAMLVADELERRQVDPAANGDAPLLSLSEAAEGLARRMPARSTAQCQRWLYEAAPRGQVPADGQRHYQHLGALRKEDAERALTAVLRDIDAGVWRPPSQETLEE
jgi:hypothetical protein